MYAAKSRSQDSIIQQRGDGSQSISSSPKTNYQSLYKEELEKHDATAQALKDLLQRTIGLRTITKTLIRASGKNMKVKQRKIDQKLNKQCIDELKATVEETLERIEKARSLANQDMN